MKTLSSLKPGDIVDVVAPASACRREELLGGVEYIRKIGLVPRVPRDLFGKSLLFSNSDEYRLAHLRRAVFARDSKMLWCVRGGYGALRLLPDILKWPKPATPKILLGYSDITSLHTHFNQKWAWPTLHGPLLDRFGRGAVAKSDEREILGLLFGERKDVEFSKLQPMNSAARKSRVIRGQVCGGNMVVLQSSLQTPSVLDPRGKILFFEELGERPYRLDRMLAHFEQVGWFRQARAVIFGDVFLANNPVEHRQIWRDVIPRFCARTKIPVVAKLPVGHDPKRNRTLPFGTRAELKLGASPSLRVTSGIS